MKKATILSGIVEGLRDLPPEDFDRLSERLIDYEKNPKFETAEDLVNAINQDLTYLKVLHDASMRRSLEKIANNSTVIKNILIFYLICSLIGAIIFWGILVSK